MTVDFLSPDTPTFGLLDASAGHLDTLRSWLEHQSPTLTVRVLRGAKCRTLAGFFDEVAAACQFPSYFGENWMAFDECTDSLGEEAGTDWVLLIQGASALLTAEPQTALETALQTWAATAAHWQAQATPRQFHVVFQDHSHSLSLVEERLNALGQAFGYLRSPLR